MTEIPKTDGTLLPSPLPRPRVRFASIAWGIIFAALAVMTLFIATSGERRSGFLDWVLQLDSSAIGLIVLLAIGLAVLLTATLTAVRRAQTRRRAAC